MNGASKPVGYILAVFFVSVWQEHGQFVSAESGDEIVPAHCAAEDVGGCAEEFVAEMVGEPRVEASGQE